MVSCPPFCVCLQREGEMEKGRVFVPSLKVRLPTIQKTRIQAPFPTVEHSSTQQVAGEVASQVFRVASCLFTPPSLSAFEREERGTVYICLRATKAIRKKRKGGRRRAEAVVVRVSTKRLITRRGRGIHSRKGKEDDSPGFDYGWIGSLSPLLFWSLFGKGKEGGE